MNVEELKSYLIDRLQVQALNPKHALSQFKLNNEDYRLSAEYTDPLHYPFFYYLGKAIKAKNLIEFGFESGIESGCFCHGCKIENYLGFRNKKTIHYWSPRLSLANISNIIKKPVGYWNGEITDPEFLKQFLIRKWDCALLVKTEDYETTKRHLTLLWNQMSYSGIIIVDKLTQKDVKKAFDDFCTIINRPNTTIRTRYGIGLVIK
jgi:hypothetical protein